MLNLLEYVLIVGIIEPEATLSRVTCSLQGFHLLTSKSLHVILNHMFQNYL